MLAARYGKSPQMVEMLLEANADVNAVDRVRVCGGGTRGWGSCCRRDSLVGHGATSIILDVYIFGLRQDRTVRGIGLECPCKEDRS